MKLDKLTYCKRLTPNNLRLTKIDLRYQLELYFTDLANREVGSWIEPNFNGRKIYHPVFMCQKIIKNGLLYISNPKREYYEVAKKYFNLLIDGAVEDSSGSLLFPYPFDFRFGNTLMKSPWYSGMAQGQVLSALSVLYNIEQNDSFAELAEKVIPTFLYFKGEANPWFSFIDEDGYFWIEEYPSDRPNHVLNGYVYALLGIYDALMNLPISEEKRILATSILNCGFRTILDKFPLYLNKNNMSFYSLMYPYFSWYYHRIHYTQAWILFLITAEERFFYYFNILREARDLKVEFRSFLGSLKREIKRFFAKHLSHG